MSDERSYRGKHRQDAPAIWTNDSRSIIYLRLGGDVPRADIERMWRAIHVEKGWPVDLVEWARGESWLEDVGLGQ